MPRRALEHRIGDIDQADGEPGLRERLRDAAAHRAGPDDADCVDVQRPYDRLPPRN